MPLRRNRAGRPAAVLRPRPAARRRTRRRGAQPRPSAPCGRYLRNHAPPSGARSSAAAWITLGWHNRNGAVAASTRAPPARARANEFQNFAAGNAAPRKLVPNRVQATDCQIGTRSRQRKGRTSALVPLRKNFCVNFRRGEGGFLHENSRFRTSAFPARGKPDHPTGWPPLGRHAALHSRNSPPLAVLRAGNGCDAARLAFARRLQLRDPGSHLVESRR